METTKSLNRMVAAIIVIGLVSLVSCSPKQAPAAGGEASAAASPAVEAIARSPAIHEGIVVSADGKVAAKTGAEWRAISIGDAVPTAAIVKTESSSSCDIQFGKVGAIRIGPNSTVELKTLSLTSERDVMDLKLLAGSITCKVNKLKSRDRFQVGTNSAVCAVRGTRFAVSERNGKPTKVAVQEGGVAILPPSFDEAKLDAIGGAGNQSVVDTVVDSIVQAALVVHGDQEMSIASTDLAKADAAVVLMQSALAANPSSEASKPEEKPAAAPKGEAVTLPESVARMLKDYSAATTGSARETLPLSAESKRAFEKAATLEVRETLPESPNAPPPQGAAATPVSAVSVAAKAPSALYGTVKVSNARLVSGIVATDRRLFAADAKGTVFAFAADGTVAWSAKTGNSENDNSRPVLGEELVAFAGDKALSVMDASSGQQRYALPLDASSSGLFGRRPAISGDRLYLATAGGIEVFDVKSGAKVGTIALPDDVEMTPAAVGTTLYAASINGVFYAMDGLKLSVTGQVKTPAAQPYAVAPLVSGGSAYFVDRKGLVVCVDLGTMTVAWSKRVDEGKNLNVLQDMTLGEAGLYVFAKSTLYGLSAKNGERLFDPIGGASSPSTLEAGALWFGTGDNTVVAVDPLSGKKLATIKVQAKVVGKPVKSGDLLAFPTESGEAVLVNPSAALR